MVKWIQSSWRKILKANRKTGFAILRGGARLFKKVSPGLHRRLTSGAGRRAIFRGAPFVVPGLTALIGYGGFSLYRYLTDDRDSLLRETKNDDAAVLATEDRLDTITVQVGSAETLRRLLIRLSSNSLTDIQAFTVLAEANAAYLGLMDNIPDPKVVEFATRNLLEMTALYRQGLTYEHVNPEIAGQALYSSMEADPSPQSLSEFLLAMEACGRSNTRLLSDTYAA